MGDRIEFSELGAASSGEESGGSSRPVDLPSKARDGRNPDSSSEPNAGTPLRESAAANVERKEGLRTIILGMCIFSAGVTIALIVQIVAGAPQLEPHGAVASPSRLCSEMGLRQLKKGGNAVDAALTTMLCIGVVTPQYSGIGGGGFMVIHNHKTHKTTLLDFRETAPYGLKTELDTYKGDRASLLKYSPLSVGVPGQIAGMWNASQRFGKLKWKTIFAPVIELAKNGFEVGMAHDLDISRRTKQLSYANEKFVNTMIEKKSEEHITRKELAQVFQDIAYADNGHDAFYKGKYAQEIIDTLDSFAHSYPAQVKIHPAMTIDDINGYQVVEREALRKTIKDFTVETFPAPGSGAILLRILSEFEEAIEAKKIAFNSVDYFTAFADVLKKVFPCRQHLGDPYGESEGLVSQFQERLVNANRTKLEPLESLCPDTGDNVDNHGTSHISVIDKDELMVSVTTSMNYWFGALQMTESGILLNNQMADFSLQEGSPNSVEGGKRPQSGMTPTVVYHHNRPCLQRFAIGGVNGSKIVSGVAEVTANLILFNETIHQSVFLPRIDCTDQVCTVQASGQVQIEDGHYESIAKVVDASQVEEEETVKETETVNLVAVALHRKNGSIVALTDDYMDWGGVDY